jgi:hypothetical protein
MRVIITAPEAKEILGEVPKGPQEASLEGDNFIFNDGKQLPKDYCTVMIVKGDVPPLKTWEGFTLHISDRFNDCIKFITSDCRQAGIIELLISKKDPGFAPQQYPVNYIDIEDDGTISFMDALKARSLEIVGGDMWNNKNRSSCSPGVLFGKIFLSLGGSSIFSSSQSEHFNNKVKSFLNFDQYIKDGIITEVHGSDIVKYYHGDYYEHGHGTLNKSCMRSSSNANQIQFYNYNKSIVRMAVLFSEDKKLIKARALIWTDVDGCNFMDRRYGIDGVSEQILSDYAKRKGYPIIDRTATPQKLIKLDKWMVKRYPYMDTFKYLDIRNGYLSNDMHKSLDSDATTTIQTTGGERSRTAIETTCVFSGENILTTEGVWCTIEGGYALPKHVITLENGATGTSHSIVTDALSGKYILKSGAVEIIGVGFTSSLSIKELVVDARTGKYLLKTDAILCSYLGKYFHRSDITCIDGAPVYGAYKEKYKNAKRYKYTENLILA